MEFIVKSSCPEKLKNSCVIVAVLPNFELGPTGCQFDKSSAQYLSHVLKSHDLEMKHGQSIMCTLPAGAACERILLVAAGDKILSPARFQELARKSAQALVHTHVPDIFVALNELEVSDRDEAWKSHQIVSAFHEASYRFENFKTNQSPRPVWKRISIKCRHKTQVSACELAIKQAQALQAGLQIYKDLANMPPNICTPSYLSQNAENLARTHKTIQTTVLDYKMIKKLGMGGLIAVGQGGSELPRFVIMQYGMKRGKKPIVLIGKGISFDTGGQSLKSPTNMVGMKYDMCGAGAVLGAFRTVAQMNLDLSLVGLIPLAENMPGPQAMRPDDIIKTLSGQTVEILNTDAEGRLILCDALSYAERFKPQAVIDMATLTGAALVALGRHASALLSNSEPLAQALIAAGEEALDRVWQLPLWDDYQEVLTSPVADMANIGNSEAGTITAACFLSRFAKKYPWAHLDIAGTACRFSGKDRGATGRPLPLLIKYLINACTSAKSTG